MIPPSIQPSLDPTGVIDIFTFYPFLSPHCRRGFRFSVPYWEQKNGNQIRSMTADFICNTEKKTKGVYFRHWFSSGSATDFPCRGNLSYGHTLRLGSHGCFLRRNWKWFLHGLGKSAWNLRRKAVKTEPKPRLIPHQKQPCQRSFKELFPSKTSVLRTPVEVNRATNAWQPWKRVNNSCCFF